MLGFINKLRRLFSAVYCLLTKIIQAVAVDINTAISCFVKTHAQHIVFVDKAVHDTFKVFSTVALVDIKK